jgi:competence protein ComEC
LPDVLVSSDGAALAVRGADGRLMIHRNSRDAFTAKEWLAADGDARLPNDKSLGEGFRCDALGCLAALTDGKLVSQVILPDALEEDCARAAVVVTSREMPGDCQALAIDRKAWRAGGAIALRRSGEGLAIERARPAGQDRPWARGVAIEEAATPVTRPQQPRDATPRSEDLEAGD